MRSNSDLIKKINYESITFLEKIDSFEWNTSGYCDCKNCSDKCYELEEISVVKFDGDLYLYVSNKSNDECLNEKRKFNYGYICDEILMNEFDENYYPFFHKFYIKVEFANGVCTNVYSETDDVQLIIESLQGYDEKYVILLHDALCSVKERYELNKIVEGAFQKTEKQKRGI